MSISWSTPSNGHAEIDQYEVQIADSSSTWQTVASCSGTTSSSLTTQECTVDMSDLWASPYSLSFDSLIQARARAHNSYGWGSFSDSNTIGARVRAVPSQMSAPEIGSYSDTSITLSWTPLTSPATGNSPILGYQLLWDNGSGTTAPDITLLDAL